MCGVTHSDKDPYTQKLARITVGYFVPPEAEGQCQPDNLRALCTSCAEGLAELPYMKRPTAQDLINILEKAVWANQEFIIAEISRRTSSAG